MRRLTVDFERYTVVRVPFPFTDRDTSKNRPAVVLSHPHTFNTPAGHSVMAMITSQANAPWPLDCTLTDLDARLRQKSTVFTGFSNSGLL